MQEESWVDIAGKDRKHKKQLVFFSIFFVCTVIAVFGFFYRFSVVQTQLLSDIQYQAHGKAMRLDNSLADTAHSLRLLEAQFYILLQTVPALDLIRFKSSADNKAYQLVQPTLVDGWQSGDLTGSGLVPQPGTLLWQQAQAAVLLTSVMERIRQYDIPQSWLYYTSASGFLYVYPYSALDIDHPKKTKLGTTFTSEMLNDPFFAWAAPEHNPGKALIWAPVYEDLAGKGPMTTASLPLYWQHSFLGVLSSDLSITELVKELDLQHLTMTNFDLLAADATSVLANKALPDGLWQKLQQGQWLRYQGSYYLKLHQFSNNWTAVLRTDGQSLIRTSLAEMFFSELAIMLCLLSVLLLWRLLSSLQQIKRMSVTDGLTLLFNRRHFQYVLSRELALPRNKKPQIGLVMLDIDFFKKYNDHYGHQGGDQVLLRVADCLSSTFRRQTDAVFRVGGEEFCVLLLARDKQHLEQSMEALCQAVRALAVEHKGSELGFLTVSVGGVWLGEGDVWDTERAYKAADDALYQSKLHGRNRWTLFHSQ